MENPDFRQVIYQALFPLGQYSVLRPQALALEILVETEVYSDMLQQGGTVLEYNVHFFLYCIGEYILFCPRSDNVAHHESRSAKDIRHNHRARHQISRISDRAQPRTA